MVSNAITGHKNVSAFLNMCIHMYRGSSINQNTGAYYIKYCKIVSRVIRGYKMALLYTYNKIG
jgi:hypothetical protein